MSDPIDLVAEVERLRAENGDMRWRLNQLEPLAKTFAAERDDARLALAMARGEGWPEGWNYCDDTDGWISPNGEDMIDCYFDPSTKGSPPKWALCVRGKWDHQNPGPYFADALSALRAYQAMVTL